MLEAECFTVTNLEGKLEVLQTGSSHTFVQGLEYEQYGI
jgi:hypothetical protein